MLRNWLSRSSLPHKSLRRAFRPLVTPSLLIQRVAAVNCLRSTTKWIHTRRLIKLDEGMGMSQATHRETQRTEHKDFAEDPALERAVHEAGTLLFKDTTMKEILAGKRQASVPKLVTVNADQTVYEAIKEMEKYKIGAVLVKDEANPKGDFVGIFTERDYLKKLALKGLTSRDTKIRNVMTAPVQWGTTKDLATHWMGRMTHERFRHVPVRDSETNQVMGVVSIGDLMKAVLVTMVDTASFLRDLIEGKYSKL